MPWRIVSPEDARLQFMLAVAEERHSFTGLCRAFGISRKTGYKWRAEFAQLGPDGLSDRSRAPHRQARAIAPDVERRILELREKQPHWGPRTLLARLAVLHPRMAWPAASTVGDLLKRKGFVPPRPRRPRYEVESPLQHARAPNDLWCADFKGDFPLVDGGRCYPLTVSDAFSRFLLCCDPFRSTRTELVQASLTKAFREYGLPKAIRTDNGTPFSALGGLSRLSVWLLKLGLQLERIKKPQHNGRHERMHRVLKLEVPPRGQTWQRAADLLAAFHHTYNYERPHHALNLVTPASVYTPSQRPFRGVPEVTYPAGWDVRAVRHDGTFKWRNKRIFISEALIGEPIGLCPLDDGLWAVYFAALQLGHFDEAAASIYAFE